MDWIAVFALGREAERLFGGCPLEAAYSLAANEYFLSFRRMKRGLRVLLDPSEPVLHACEKTRDAREPSPAAMLVRKHLERGKLKRARVPAGERILMLDFDPGILALELIPGKGNLAVVWDGFLMGSHAPLVRGEKTIRSGDRYALPAREGVLDIFKVTRKEFEEAASRQPSAAREEKNAGKKRLEARGWGLKALFPYLPAWFCEEFAARGGGWEAFAALVEELKGDKGVDFLYGAGSARPVVSPMQLISRRGEAEAAFGSFSEAVAAYVEARRAGGALDSPAAKWMKRLRAEEKRHSRTLEKLAKERGDAKEAWRERRKGELILIALSNRVPPGAGASPRVEKGVLLTTDIYEDPPAAVSITLDPAKTLQENAARLFKRAKRLERALPQIEARMRETEAALRETRERMAAVEANPEAAEEPPAPDAPYGASAGRQPTANRQPKLKGIRVFRSSDGLTIYVGKDSKANDRLTLRVARPHDLWLHASGFGGSHVVVMNPHKEKAVPERTAREAAELAAHFSKGRLNARLDVVAAVRRHVRKRKGAPAGQVTLAKFETLRVEPKIGVEEVLRAKKG